MKRFDFPHKLPLLKLLSAVSLLTLAFFASACEIVPTALPGTPATSTVSAPATQAVTATAAPVTEATATTAAPATEAAPTNTVQPAPSDTPTPTTAPETPSAYKGFVVFLPEQKEFQGYDLEGTLMFRYGAPGLDYSAPNNTEVVGENVYYISNIDHALYRTNDEGVQIMNLFSYQSLYGFSISPDETQIAWSNGFFNETPAKSELWLANMDGSNAHQIATYNTDQSPAFLFVPLEWTADGKLLFDRTPVGFGGYILFGGHNALYSYDPSNSQFVTLVPAEEMHGLCLDEYRLDLNVVAFNCGPNGSQIVLRNLNSSAETTLPVLAEQGAAGSVRFSPDGKWIAYAIAKGNPDNESGKIVVGPADLSAAPEAIASVDNGYDYLNTWLDNDSLLFTKNDQSGLNNSSIAKIHRDGSGETLLAQGTFIGMIR